MLGNRLKIFGCEANKQSYIKSGLINELSTLHKDALSNYTTIKYRCSRGHTFISESKLRPRNERALEFLEKEHVVKLEMETCGSSRRVYLYRLWKAERAIANGVQELFKIHCLDPWSLGVDFERYSIWV